jgi:alkanesulfonate monooxygenase SsuD/methylene tetrahydromethanopterin reductase-like flavin-dependent oxidoreductase (luciferase family)
MRDAAPGRRTDTWVQEGVNVDIAVGLPTNLRNVRRERVLEWAQRAETAGFSTVGMGERLTFDGWDWCVSLTAAAAVTSRVRLLSNVVILPIHPVGVLAKQALSLDAFSDGRLMLGVGIGAPVYDYDVAVAPRAGRTARFEEHMTTLKELWQGKSLIEGLRPIGPPPVREGGPPLLVGALGPKGLRRVGQFADGLVTWSFAADAAEVRAMFDIVEASWVDFGRTGKPWLMAGCYYSVGPTAADDLDAYFRDYYPHIYPGPVDGLIATVRTTTDQAIRDTVRQFEDIGCDEFLFQPINASMHHLDGLAELVL